MSGPKHLWSGDWRQESADAAKTRPHRPPAAQPPPEQPPPAETRPRRPGSRKLRRGLPIALTAIVLVGAAAWGLTALLGAGSDKAPSFANAPSTPSVATPASIQARPVYWLGMQIETVAPGAAVVETVTQGSPGELAGLSPGDLILAVNGRSIHGAGDIAGAIQGLKSGDQVPIQISHGSALFTAQATLAAPPADHP
jgi:membrane-associated protease RseP (regulator of RpoE activity)